MTPIYKTFSDALLMQDFPRIQSILTERHTFLDLNRYCRDGQTPLHHCSSSGNLKLVRLLVEHGANPRRKNKEGWTPLHLSVFRGHRKITAYLLKILIGKREKVHHSITQDVKPSIFEVTCKEEKIDFEEDDKKCLLQLQ
ncbi:hypothetical protein HELRODRAFT_187992 [Helobdella robusta]|uniref:Uncharacterized protein n=1 Tax=Helobdella robusta TaxID=6412 RepID=T1FPJ0_HELRO|nr:hypothetical protein HELRODRAFT_187992 [Helobdella robusta]ESO12818.1 hypothetical protein HELRODRAFT_187992 [Helobdella robusta]